jgi:LPXTG-motif cell wall-anchored protein
MRTERMSPPPEEGLGDLFEQLLLTVYLKDTEIYSGPMKDYATSNISLGMFNPGDVKDLKAIVHLPGLETGNEFQDATVEVKWIFIAQADKGPDKPDKPDKPDEPDEPWIPPKEPDKPAETTKPGELPESEEPIEEIEDEEVPTGEPEVKIPDEPEEESQEKVEEKIPKGKPKLPKTGEAPLMFFYISGTLMVLLGIGLESKNKK